MPSLTDNKQGFSAVELIMVIVIVGLIGAVGYFVYKNHHQPTKTVTVTKTVTAPAKSSTSSNTQQYLTITAWGVKVPYPSGDTLTASAPTCTENGDSAGDTINLGCQVNVNSKNLASSVGSCQSTKATGVVGYFYRMGANDNYNETSGAGYEPVAQWAAANTGKYTQIGSYYYAFAEIGAAWGGQGAVSINTSTNALADTVPAGCSNWVAEYNVVEPLVKPLASKFVAVQ